MKSPNLFIALLFASILALQVQSLKLREQAALQSDEQQYAKRLDFKELLNTAFTDSDSTQTIANVYRYYIDGSSYFNYIQKLFCRANTNDGEFITLDQYLAIATEQGIHEVDARRIANYIRGIFGSIRHGDEDIPIDAFRFTQAVDILFAESVSLVTFIHITHTSRITKTVTVSLDDVKEALVAIFKLLQDTYPLPDCNELAYLFTQSDVDHDGRLNLQEFHVFLSIYIRFYKYGILSNRYAAIIMKDEIYNYVFHNQETLGGRRDRTQFLTTAFKRFFQLSISDAKTNQISHLFFTKFDSDGSGAIDPEEFRTLLSFFHAPLNEVNVLFISADTDGNGVVDFSEFVIVITTLLRRLTADIGESLIRETDGTNNVDDSFRILRQIERDENINIIESDKFRELFRAVNVGDHYALSSERFALLISEVVAYAKAKLRLIEEGQITAIAGTDVDNTSYEEIFAIKQEASEQVNDIVYNIGTVVGIEPTEPQADEAPEEISALIDEVQKETGVTYAEIEEAVEDQIHGASIEDVIQTITAITTEEVLDAVATSALEEVAEEECPTRAGIEQAIEHAIEDGAADEVEKDAEHLSAEEIIETVTEVVTTQQTAEEVTQTINLHGDIDTKEILETIEAETGAELSTEEFVEIIEEATGTTDYKEVLDIIENSAPEDLIDTATEVIQEEVTAQEPAGLEWRYEEAVVENIQEEAETPIEDLEAAIEEQTGGATIEDVIEAATSIATEEFAEVVTAAVLEEAESTECPTVEAVEQAIEQAIEDGAADEIIHDLQETPSEDIVEAVIEALEESEQSEESEESEEEEPETVIEQIEQESGLNEDDLEDAVQSQIEGATVEEYVEAAEDIASTQVVEAITDAVYHEAWTRDCVTEEGIVETIEDVIEGGVIEEIVEEIEKTPSDEVIEAVTAVIEEEHPQPEPEPEWPADEEPEQFEEDVSHEIEENTGYTGEQIGVAIQEELGAIDLDEVIEVAQEIAKEEVIGAVTDAAYEEAESNECVSQEDIHEAIQEVIYGGAVETAVEQIEEETAEDVLQTITETLEEHRDEEKEQEQEVEQQVEEESGASSETIQEFIEAETGGESITEIIEAAQEIATEEFIEAVADAAVEEAASNECVTAETIESIVENTLEGDTFEEIIEQLEEASNDEILEAVSEAIEEEGDQEESRDSLESSYLQVSSNKSNLKHKNFLRKLRN